VCGGMWRDEVEDAGKDFAMDVFQTDLWCFDEADVACRLCEDDGCVVAECGLRGAGAKVLEVGEPLELRDVEAQPCGEGGNGVERRQWEGDEHTARLGGLGTDEAIHHGELGTESCAGKAEAAIGEEKGYDLAMTRAR
jgi:hypothetical protein